MIFDFISKREGLKKGNAWLQIDDAAPCPIGGKCSIGRAKTNTISIPSQKASRLHALIHEQEHEEYWLVDLGSSNGTYLNGRRVMQPFHLKDGDLIQIGEHRILFFIKAPDDKEKRAQLEEDQMTVREMEGTPCWILIADIENFVSLGTSLDSDGVARAMGEWFATCDRIIHSHRGMISQYLGGGFVAYWDGRRIPAEQISTCLESLKKTLGDSPLKFRLAVHFGKASTGGPHVPGNKGVYGQDVSLAFSMEKLAKTLSVQCIISDTAYEAFSRPAAAKELGYHALKGNDKVHLFYEL